MKHSTKGCRKSEQPPSLYTDYMMLEDSCVDMDTKCWDMDRGCWTWTRGAGHGDEVLDMDTECWTWRWSAGQPLASLGRGWPLSSIERCPGHMCTMFLICSSLVGSSNCVLSKLHRLTGEQTGAYKWEQTEGSGPLCA